LNEKHLIDINKDMTPNLVQDFLTSSARIYPHKVCLIAGEKKYTYQQLDRLSNQFAQQLRKSGLKRGDRVAIFLGNVPEQAIIIFGILKAGGVFIVINHTTKQDKLAYILKNSQAHAIIAPANQKEMLLGIMPTLPELKYAILVDEASESRLPFFKFEDFLTQGSPLEPRKQNIDRDLACLIYTSGSTGEPKGVMSDHSNVVFVIQSITTYLENTPDDIILNAVPLSFDYGLYQLLMTISFGGTMILEKGFVYPALIMKKIEEYRVTGFPGVPTMFSLILNMDLNEIDFSSLRYMTNTAAALSRTHIQKIKNTFPNVRFFSMYGLTETKRTLYLPPEDLENKPDSVGIPIPGTEAWVEDEVGNHLEPGQIGELVIRGRHVMRGYWHDEAATNQRYRPGEIPGEKICYSGDLFKMDEDGYFYFIARKDDIIKSRGEKVSPKEVENILYQFTGVQEAAVIGVPDPVLGQAVKAFVVLNQPDINVNDILRYCKNNMEDFMVPKSVVIVAELPKTSSGKIKKTDLI